MTLYDLLGIPQNAEYGDIRLAYWRRASEVYPERNDSPAKRDRLLKLRQAYEILSHPKKREEYDLMITPQKFEIEEDPAAKQPNPVYLDPFEEWVSIFLMSWKDLAVFPLEVKLKRLAIAFTTRVLAGLLGALLGIWVTLQDTGYLHYGTFGKEDVGVFFHAIRYAAPILAALFFLGCRVLLYQVFRREKTGEDN